jgi:hypothetical protein
MSTTTPASTRPRGRRHRLRRLVPTVVAVVVGLTALAACEPDVAPPYWVGGKTVTASPLGPHVVLDWRDAYGATSYQVQVAEVTGGTPGPWATVTMDAPATSACAIVGLTAARQYEIRITAYDAAGNWSGDLTGSQDVGSLGTSYATPSGSGGGPTRRCRPATDTDGDRAPDVLETGTGSYGGVTALGTYPTDADSDDDGLKDGDEAFGTAWGLRLPDLGVRPLGKDLLVETDWATNVTACSAPDLRPTTAWLDILKAAFARLPLDGPQFDGVKVIVDYGQGGVFTGGNAIPDANGKLDHDPFQTYARTTNFDPSRVGYFHYISISTFVFWSNSWHGGGLASQPGDDVRLGFGCDATMTDWAKARIAFHELGHNLDLGHGGHENRNWKPNYSSVMNSRYIAGADLDCDGQHDPGVLRFSEQKRADLDENNLNEVAGICPGKPADLDRDFVIDQGTYAADINFDSSLGVLVGSNDMEHISLAAFSDPTRMAGSKVVDGCPDPLI